MYLNSDPTLDAQTYVCIEHHCFYLHRGSYVTSDICLPDWLFPKQLVKVMDFNGILGKAKYAL